MTAFRFTTLAHADRDILGPLSDAALDAMLDRVHGTPARTLDVGCGKGALLARVHERFGGEVHGVEPNPDFAAATVNRLVANGAEFMVFESELEHAPLPRHGFDLAFCLGASHAFGTPDDALEGLAALVPPRGVVVLGEGYWRRDPDPEYAALLGGEDSMRDHAGNAARGRAFGLSCEWARESTLEEWDAYEGAYAGAMRAWCDANPGDPETPAFRERIERWNAVYHRWGRDTLGFGLYVFRAHA